MSDLFRTHSPALVRLALYLMPDQSGRYLLVLGFGADNTAVVDVATRRPSVLPVRYSNSPLGASW